MSPTKTLVLSAALFALVGPAFAKDVAVKYTCQDGKKLAVTYHFREATMAASTKLDGKKVELAYDNQSDAMSPTFKNGPYTMMLDKFDIKTVKKAGGLNLTKDSKDTVNGKTMDVSQMLYKGCNPK